MHKQPKTFYRKISDLFTNQDQSKENSSNTFSSLDGFRGMLAVFVIMAHSNKTRSCETINYIENKARVIPVDGFFVLSAFLLTYRLLTELLNSNENIRKQVLIVLKYFVRRFFRIYVVYFIYVSAVSFGPSISGGLYSYSPWYVLVTLGNLGLNHLWTIPPEIKYYFIIPIICLIASKFGRNLYVFLIMCILWSLLNEKLNFLRLIDSDFSTENRHILKTRFTVFFSGSIAGIALVIIDTTEALKQFVKDEFSQILISFISLFMFALGFVYENSNLYLNENYAGRIWASVVLLMAIGAPNMLTNFFSQTNVLKSCGKVSFGMYLLHPMFIAITHKFNIQFLLFFEVTVLFLTYHGAYLFFRFIEMPLIDLANRICKQFEKIEFFQNEFVPVLIET